MRAYLMNGPGQLSIGEVPDPVCGPDEIVLETEAVSICSTDVSYFRGHLFSQEWPIVPGHEYVGRVVDVGASLDGTVATGERVCYWGQTDFGGMAEYRTIRPIFGRQHIDETSWYTDRSFYDAEQSAAVVVPESLQAHQATIVEPLTSVLRALLVNPPRPGDICVVLGCGPSALLAVQVLKGHFGAGTVLVLDRNQARIALALQNGAHAAFNTGTDAANLEQFVRDNNDEYADYVFDALPHVTVGDGGETVRDLAMGLLRPGGTYVVYGATEVRQEINTWLILAKGLNIRATPFDVRLFSMARSAHVAAVALRLIESGLVQVAPIVTQRTPFQDEQGVRAAFETYGHGSSMKTSISVTESAALSDPQQQPVSGRRQPVGASWGGAS